MNKHLTATSKYAAVTGNVFTPILINRDTSSVAVKLDLLLKAKPCIKLLDSIQCQLKELMKARNPGIPLSENDIADLILEFLAGVEVNNYGNWFYYPWAEKVVHLLPESEFVELRTNRNRNKITLGEQQSLAKAKIGVVGLSVGRSVALTLAQERVCGEIRLADFDQLELSNLNRLRATVFDLEQNKTTLTARAIAEMDPYIKVKCFDNGLDEQNIDDFFSTGGKLDILVEECDGLDMKIKARLKAKALRVPVVMDTNDRGMLDIERFDLEPDRPLLHGKLDGLDLSTLSPNMTTEEKVPFVASILGIDQMSTRMKASMMEVDHTIKSWPQLASSVSLGAALCTNVSRRILLGQHRESGRWHIDIDELTLAKPKELLSTLAPIDLSRLTPLDEPLMLSTAKSYLDVNNHSTSGNLSLANGKALASAAMLAPSGGNSQPWHFLFDQNRLFLFLDQVRAFSTIDPGHRYAYFALGACLENMHIASSKLDQGIKIERTESNENGLVAIIDAGVKRAAYSPNLLQHLGTRCTNRKKGNTVSLSREFVNRLTRLNTQKNTMLTLVQSRDKIEKIAKLCGKAERIRMLNPKCHWDMFEREMRWTAKEALETKDGVDVRTLELSFSDQTGLQVARDSKAVELIKAWKGGSALEELTEKVTQLSSALCIISLDDLTVAASLDAGSLLQQLWLHCTKEGIAVQPISAPAYMGIHYKFDNQEILSQEEHAEAALIYDELRKCADTPKDFLPFFILRLSYADDVTVKSERRSLDQHLTISHSTHTYERPENAEDSILQSNR